MTYYGKSVKTDFNILTFYKISNVSHFSITPKKYNKLLFHMIDVGTFVETVLSYSQYNTIFNKYFSSKDFSIIAFIASLHDIGKATDNFQLKISTEKKTEEMHPEAGLSFLKKYYIKERVPSFNKNLTSFLDEFINSDLSLISQYHHGFFPSKDKYLININNDENIKYMYSLINTLYNVFNPSFSSSDLAFLKNNFYILRMLSGLIIFADWITSNKKYFPYSDPSISSKDYYIKSKEKSKEIFLTLNLIKEFNSFEDIILLLNFKNLSPLQNFCSSFIPLSTPSLIIIEDQMGSGKTEASILLASKLKSSGVVFCLPTQATTNAIYKRMKTLSKYLIKDKFSLSLSHSNSNKNIEYTSNLVSFFKESSHSILDDNNNVCLDFFKNKSSLLANFSVCTIDQVLSAVTSQNHNTLTLFSLMNKTIIFDEIHSNDSYMNGLLINLLEILRELNCNIILMSATLSSEEKNLFHQTYDKSFISSKNAKYPLITSSQEFPIKINENKTYEFRYSSQKKDIFIEINKAINNNSNILIIKNSVTDAISLYEELLEEFKNCEIILFHSRFIFKDKQNKENKILNYFSKKDSTNRYKKIVIATQVVEQSLDIDFSYMVTDLAPAANLLQRAGRFKRHKRNINEELSLKEERKNNEILIIGPVFVENPLKDWFQSFFRNSHKIYQNYLCFQTLKKFKKLNFKINIKKNIRYLIESDFKDKSELCIMGIAERESDIYLKNFASMRAISKETNLYSHSDDCYKTRLISPSKEYILYDNQKLIGGTAENSKISIPLFKLDYDKDIIYFENGFVTINKKQLFYSSEKGLIYDKH